jgi:hypothetical protein
LGWAGSFHGRNATGGLLGWGGEGAGVPSLSRTFFTHAHADCGVATLAKYPMFIQAGVVFTFSTTEWARF